MWIVLVNISVDENCKKIQYTNTLRSILNKVFSKIKYIILKAVNLINYLYVKKWKRNLLAAALKIYVKIIGISDGIQLFYRILEFFGFSIP